MLSNFCMALSQVIFSDMHNLPGLVTISMKFTMPVVLCPNVHILYTLYAIICSKDNKLCVNAT